VGAPDGSLNLNSTGTMEYRFSAGWRTLIELGSFPVFSGVDIQPTTAPGEVKTVISIPDGMTISSHVAGADQMVYNDNTIEWSGTSGLGMSLISAASIDLDTGSQIFIGDEVVYDETGVDRLSVNSTTGFFKPTRMTVPQRNAVVSPNEGSINYDSDVGKISFYNGSSWIELDDATGEDLQGAYDAGNGQISLDGGGAKPFVVNDVSINNIGPSVLHASGTTGFLTTTNMSSLERDAVTGTLVAGHLNLSSIDGRLEYYDGSAWRRAAQLFGNESFKSIDIIDAGLQTTLNDTGIKVFDNPETNKSFMTETELRISDTPETEYASLTRTALGIVGANRVLAVDSAQGIDISSLPIGSTVSLDENSINVDPGSGLPKSRMDSAGITVDVAPAADAVAIDNTEVFVSDVGATTIARMKKDSLILNNASQAINLLLGTGLQVHNVPNTKQVTINENTITATAALEIGSPDLTINTLRPVLRQLGKLDQTVVANTTVETSILGTFTGTNAVDANSLFQGSDFKMTAGGLLTTDGINQTIHIRVYLGAAIIADTGVITLTAVSTNEHLEIELDSIIFRQIGAATVAETMASGEFAYREDNNPNIKKTFSMLTNNTTTVDTTVANNLNVTVQWGAANPANSITIDTLSFERIG
jgi:hypothetical protein